MKFSWQDIVAHADNQPTATATAAKRANGATNPQWRTRDT
jgi:hypothetical protein